MGEVVPVRGGHDPARPNADLVRDLGELLRRAESGQLRSMIYGTVDHQGNLSTGWVGEAGDRWRLGSLPGILSYRYAKTAMESET